MDNLKQFDLGKLKEVDVTSLILGPKMCGVTTLLNDIAHNICSVHSAQSGEGMPVINEVVNKVVNVVFNEVIMCDSMPEYIHQKNIMDPRNSYFFSEDAPTTCSLLEQVSIPHTSLILTMTQLPEDRTAAYIFMFKPYWNEAYIASYIKDFTTISNLKSMYDDFTCLVIDCRAGTLAFYKAEFPSVHNYMQSNYLLLESERL